jgi:hypothetical protein
VDKVGLPHTGSCGVAVQLGGGVVSAELYWGREAGKYMKALATNGIPTWMGRQV